MMRNLYTHAGAFHADDVLSTVFLQLYLGEKNCKINRVLEVPDGIGSFDIVYDMGRGEFDHHQMDSAVRPNGVKYCSLGLLWRAFGLEYLKENYPKVDAEAVFAEFDRAFIQSICMRDNGQVLEGVGVRENGISQVIFEFNPTWDSKFTYDKQFYKALKVAKAHFLNSLQMCISNLKAVSIIQEDLKTSTAEVLVLSQGLPWKEFVISSPETAEIKFVIFPSDRGGYRVQGVNTTMDSFELRKPLPQELWGKDHVDFEFQGKKGQAVFVHASGFIGITETFESALLLAEYALSL